MPLSAALARLFGPRPAAPARPRRAALSVDRLDDRSLPSTVTANLGAVLQDNFQGAGYHVLTPNDMSDRTFNEVFAKRVSEVHSNSYARIFYALSDFAPDATTRTPDSPGMRNLVRILDLYQRLGTTVYLTGIYSSKGSYFAGEPITDPTLRAQYADAVGDLLENLVRTRGLTCVKQWCLTNELAGGFDGQSGNFDYSDGAARLVNYEEHVRLVRAEIAGRDLGIQVQATDDLGRADVMRGSIPWAVRNMNDQIDVYGGHDYAHDGEWWAQNPYAGDGWSPYPSETGDNWYDPALFRQIQIRYRYYADLLVRGTGKDFVIGELGGRGESVDSSNGRLDAAHDRNDSRNGVYLADKLIAALNAGVGGVAKWALNDSYQLYGPNNWRYENQWGNWADDANGHAVRAEHYAYGLLSRYVQNDSTVYSVSGTEANVHAAAVRNNRTGKYTFVVTNRTGSADSLTFQFQGSTPGLTTLRRFVYDPSAVPSNAFGDLPAHSGTVTVSNGRFTDTVPAGVLVVYTNDFDTVAPAAVSGVTRVDAGSAVALSWSRSPESDVMYYRVYRGTSADFTPGPGNRVGSTFAATLTDTVGGAPSGYFYVVRAVDRSGNESPLPAAGVAPLAIVSASTTGTVNSGYLVTSHDGQTRGWGSYQTLGLMAGQQATYTLAQASTLSQVDIALGMSGSRRLDLSAFADGAWRALGRVTWSAAGGAYQSFAVTPTPGTTQVRVTAADDWAYLDEVRPMGAAAPSNVAAGRPAFASSVEGSGLEPGKATDGNSGTRWSSQYADNQWLYVDLGRSVRVSEVRLNWETAAGRDYKLQWSNDPAAGWTDFGGSGTVTGNAAAGWKAHAGLSADARYVRILCQTRATQWGFSLWDFQVLGF